MLFLPHCVPSASASLGASLNCNAFVRSSSCSSSFQSLPFSSTVLFVRFSGCTGNATMCRYSGKEGYVRSSLIVCSIGSLEGNFSTAVLRIGSASGLPYVSIIGVCLDRSAATPTMSPTVAVPPPLLVLAVRELSLPPRNTFRVVKLTSRCRSGGMRKR